MAGELGYVAASLDVPLDQAVDHYSHQSLTRVSIGVLKKEFRASRRVPHASRGCQRPLQPIVTALAPFGWSVGVQEP
jgi:hypothetical protein